MKLFQKVLFIFLIVLFSPLILILILFYGISLPFIGISRRITYKQSAYYKDFKIQYKKSILDSYGYVFYNCAKEMNFSIQYMIQKSNELEYFIYNQQVFLFPDFSGLEYNKNTNSFDVFYWKHNQKTTCSLEEYLNNKIRLFEEKPDLPIRLLVSRDLIKEKKLDLSNLPETLYLVRNYYSCFNEEYQENPSLIPTTTTELYEMMKNNDKLGGHIELENDNQIVWTFENVIYEITVNGDDGIISVYKNNLFKFEITHWHPYSYEIYYDICNIGEKGNILVIRSFLNTSSVLYMGKKENCPYIKKKILFGGYYFFEPDDL